MGTTRVACGGWLAACVWMALAGCASSPPIKYYTLDMRASGRAQPPVKLEIDRLRPAEAVDRREIQIQKAPTEIEYYPTQQWAGSLGELIAQKLDAEFAQPADPGRRLVVSGTILDFEQVDMPSGATAHAQLNLKFRTPGASQYDPPLLDGTYDVTVPAAGRSAGAVVMALSKALEDIAARVAQDLQGVKMP